MTHNYSSKYSLTRLLTRLLGYLAQSISELVTLGKRSFCLEIFRSNWLFCKQRIQSKHLDRLLLEILQQPRHLNLDIILNLMNFDIPRYIFSDVRISVMSIFSIFTYLEKGMSLFDRFQPLKTNTRVYSVYPWRNCKKFARNIFESWKAKESECFTHSLTAWNLFAPFAQTSHWTIKGLLSTTFTLLGKAFG